MKAFEDATGEPLDEDKKELASEELITTGDLGEDIGQDKATGIVNDVKTEIIKNNTKDTVQIAETINNVVNNYNVTLSDEQMAKLENLMAKISEQDYNYNEMKNALESVSNVVNENLSAMGESVNKGFFDSIKNFFTGIGDWFKETFGGESKDSSILESTNDNILGENAQIDATDKSTINLPSSEEVEGFFAKIINWFKGLFNNESDSNQDNTQQTEIVPNEQNNTNEETSNILDENSSTEETPQDNADTSVSNEDDETLDVQTEDQGSFDTQEQQSN